MQADTLDKLTRAGLNLIQQALSIFDSDLRPLACTKPLPAEAVRTAATGRYGSFEWGGTAGAFLAGHFTENWSAEAMCRLVVQRVQSRRIA